MSLKKKLVKAFAAAVIFSTALGVPPSPAVQQAHAVSASAAGVVATTSAYAYCNNAEFNRAAQPEAPPAPAVKAEQPSAEKTDNTRDARVSVIGMGALIAGAVAVEKFAPKK